MAGEGKNQLNLTLIEPPLKKFKSYTNSNELKTEPVSIERLSPKTLNAQLQADAAIISGELIDFSFDSSPKESTLDKWKRSFQPSSLNEINLEKEMDEIELLSDGFFSELKDDNANEEDQFDFDLSEIDDQVFESSTSSSKFESRDSYHRVKIIKIQESFYVIEGQKFQHPQKVLDCLLIKNDVCMIDYAPLQVFIRGDWLYCKLNEESVINIVGPIKNGEIIIDNDENYLVVEPDILINNTAIADSFSCMRKAVIAYRTQLAVEDTKPNASLICGSIVHELVGEAFKTGNFKEIKPDDLKLNKLITQNIEKIFCCEKDEKFVKERVLETMINFQKWCMLYIRKSPAIHAYVQDPNRKPVASSKSTNTSNSKEKATICLSKVLDLEENIWSVMFGLKGKVDATLLTKSKVGNLTSKNFITPFELKTGHTTTSVAHRAQTLLYTLLLFDRYKRPIDYGLLFYISTGDLIRIPAFRDEIRSILIKRNQLAEELVRSEKYPEQIRNEHLCKQCNHVDSCIMIHRLNEGGKVETSSIPKLFESKTEHLLMSDLRYETFFQKWQSLITLEESETVSNRSELWKFDSERRSGRGKCLNEMKIISCKEVEEMKESGMNQYVCVFKKDNSVANELKVSLLNSYFNERDPVVISSEDPLNYAIATGIVKSLTTDLISIYTDRPILIGPQPDESLEEDFEGDFPTFSERIKTFKFCIDKNELTGSFGLMRANVIKLFSLECQKLLDLIVNLRPPKYMPRVKFDESILKNFDSKFGMYEDYCKMDEYQREAFYRSIETLDYLLILGMPGTGKTTTLAFIIRYLVLIMGKSILISSHTHSAIDHIALKLQERNFPFLRIGNGDRIDKNILKENILDSKKFESVSEVEDCYSRARVVISTSLGMNHSIFMRKRFDFCFVDEASQLTLPACVGSLKVSNSFILVGDHFQLPPLVRSKEALKNGFGESLFKILAESHPEGMVKLCNQYRMNDEIMLMANRLTYQNLLKCGSEQVKNQKLLITFVDDVDDVVPVWLSKILNPNCKVAFLNTDTLKLAHEVVNGNSFHNEIEAKIVKTIVKFSLKFGIHGNQISLISPYRPQLKYLNFPDLVDSHDHPIISTIDKYQGKDCDFVIISLVRSNSNGNIGELLNDWQRLNVAFTRAKKKLILIGSAGTILENSSFNKLKNLINERGWMINEEITETDLID